MVCLGNICRSPLAEGILLEKAKQLSIMVKVDSAGTSSNHIGENPDPRSIEIGLKHGINISNQRARQFHRKDFTDFDHILVMDQSNYNNVLKLTNDQKELSKVKMILNYTTPNANTPVPDPYYGGEDGFQKVYSLLDTAIDQFISKEFNA